MLEQSSEAVVALAKRLAVAWLSAEGIVNGDPKVKSVVWFATEHIEAAWAKLIELEDRGWSNNHRFFLALAELLAPVFNADVHQELAVARATIKNLNRRCQKAEAAVKENLAACLRAGISLSRKLSEAGYWMERARAERLEQALAIAIDALPPGPKASDTIQAIGRTLKDENPATVGLEAKARNAVVQAAIDLVDGRATVTTIYMAVGRLREVQKGTGS